MSEPKWLTDEEIRQECIPCYCFRCGMQLWIHMLYPLVGAELMAYHGCVPKAPILFEKTEIELKPYDMPVSKLFDLDYKYGDNK